MTLRSWIPLEGCWRTVEHHPTHTRPDGYSRFGIRLESAGVPPLGPEPHILYQPLPTDLTGVDVALEIDAQEL
ncbi:MAG: hypothetical protein VYA70_09720, partial [Gemmatimonadota bacterium]|nr:hypothetical protein [Gemmatimonadota bacterium]